jgi:hypothetical protein
MPLKLGPKLKVLIDKFQSSHIVLRQSDFFPELVWQVSTLYCLKVEVNVTLVLADCSIARIR